MGFQEHYFCLGGMKEVIKILGSVICLVLAKPDNLPTEGIAGSPGQIQLAETGLLGGMQSY